MKQETKLPRGLRNNNPLNIKRGSRWQGLKAVQTDETFCQFNSMIWGIRAGFVLLRNYISGYSGKTKPFDTIEKIISRWAPSSENQTQRYIDFVSKQSGIPSNQKIKFTDRAKMISIVSAMIKFENGKDLPRDLIQSSYDLL